MVSEINSLVYCTDQSLNKIARNKSIKQLRDGPNHIHDLFQAAAEDKDHNHSGYHHVTTAFFANGGN